MSDWAGVRERVLALAAAPDGDEVFGAGGHGFELEEPLTAAALAEVESLLGVELPHDYRTFLLEVGAGGAGPAYGLFPLQRVGEVPGAWRWIGDGGETADPAVLAEPFPGPVDPTELAALVADQPDDEDYPTPADFDPAYEAWDARLTALLYDPHHTAGAICLCHEGCALRVWLVVTGPERGHMWFDPRCDLEDLRPLRDARGEPVSFADWYLGWLAEAESTCGMEITPEARRAGTYPG
ncbi:SMI1/KNR4 family protein [Catenulispora pinisilvae]|uniref:SMI1/KNR4 family protein n=1 Tax=Catenulispora pinisilvae TaxID=2705253 RepID=UPI00189157AD|nr:SMI1/KNR4 family protein [Catenulispora pinisilvae]